MRLFLDEINIFYNKPFTIKSFSYKSCRCQPPFCHCFPPSKVLQQQHCQPGLRRLSSLLLSRLNTQLLHLFQRSKYWIHTSKVWRIPNLIRASRKILSYRETLDPWRRGYFLTIMPGMAFNCLPHRRYKQSLVSNWSKTPLSSQYSDWVLV